MKGGHGARNVFCNFFLQAKGVQLKINCFVLICLFFCVPDTQGECTRENPQKLKVHLCIVQVHPETEQTKGLCIMLA